VDWKGAVILWTFKCERFFSSAKGGLLNGFEGCGKLGGSNRGGRFPTPGIMTGADLFGNLTPKSDGI
jgi:hypothetical protein